MIIIVLMNVIYAMIGERTANVFRIGDEITIRVINVNKDERSIDFEIVGMKVSRPRPVLEKDRCLKRIQVTESVVRDDERSSGVVIEVVMDAVVKESDSSNIYESKDENRRRRKSFMKMLQMRNVKRKTK